MVTITNLNQISPNQLKRVIENSSLTIKKTANTHYQIVCPECNKAEAYIYFNQGNRVIQCNRKNKCNFSQSLWEYISIKNNYSSKELTRYINELLGYEFNDFSNKRNEQLVNRPNLHHQQTRHQNLHKL